MLEAVFPTCDIAKYIWPFSLLSVPLVVLRHVVCHIGPGRY
jgi:hypothetical protein